MKMFSNIVELGKVSALTMGAIDDGWESNGGGARGIRPY